MSDHVKRTTLHPLGSGPFPSLRELLRIPSIYYEDFVKLQYLGQNKTHSNGVSLSSAARPLSRMQQLLESLELERANWPEMSVVSGTRRR